MKTTIQPRHVAHPKDVVIKPADIFFQDADFMLKSSLKYQMRNEKGLDVWLSDKLKKRRRKVFLSERS